MWRPLRSLHPDLLLPRYRCAPVWCSSAIGHTDCRPGSCARFAWRAETKTTKEEEIVKKTCAALLAAATVAGSLAVATSDASAYYRGWGFGPGLAAGLIGGAVI